MNGGKQRLLAAAVMIDQSPLNTCCLGNITNRSALETALGKELLCSIKDAVAGCQRAFAGCALSLIFLYFSTHFKNILPYF